jgi:hypothetical protein
VRPWPAGEDCAAADFAAVDAEGAPLVGALRKRLDLGVLAATLEAALRLEPLFGALLAQAPPPVRLGAPALTLAGVEIPAAVDLALKHLGFPRGRSRSRAGRVSSPPRGSGRRDAGAVAPRRSFLPPAAAARARDAFKRHPAPRRRRYAASRNPAFDGRG